MSAKSEFSLARRTPIGHDFSLMRTSLFALFAALFLTLTATAASAEGIEVRSATLVAEEDGWSVEADFDVQLNRRLEEAINRGVPLYFVVDFEIARPRWYWLDEKPVQQSLTYKVSYTPLLRQYRLSVGSN